MTVDEYAAYPAELTLRELKVGKKVLVTSFLNPREVCKREVGKLFVRRWNMELDLRNIKSTLGMERLTCRTQAMCEKELWVYALAYNLIRLLMAEAAVQAGALPRQLSFKHTVQVWVAWSQRQFQWPGIHPGAVPIDRPCPSRKSTRADGAQARQDSTETLRTPADNASPSTREHQKIWASQETHGLT